MVVKWWVQNRCLCPYCRLCIFRFHSFSQKIRIWYSNLQKPIRRLWSMQTLYCHLWYDRIFSLSMTSRFLKQSKLYVSYPDPSVFQGLVLDKFFINQRPLGSRIPGGFAISIAAALSPSGVAWNFGSPEQLHEKWRWDLGRWLFHTWRWRRFPKFDIVEPTTRYAKEKETDPKNIVTTMLIVWNMLCISFATT